VTPDPLTLPDYAGGSIANLMGSLAVAFGRRHWPYPPLRLLPPALLQRHSHVLLLVVDGLGYRYLCDAHRSSTLHQCVRGNMTSVFPSTTATAITALMTGVAPQQHGLTGWHIYFDEAETVAAVLPFRTRATDQPLTQRGLLPATLFTQPAFADQLPVSTTVISPMHIVHSEFNAAHSGRAQRVGYDSLSEFFQRIDIALRGPGERKFVYAYYPELDSTAHEHGIGARHTAEVLKRFDQGFSRLLSALAGGDVTVLVTADHGFVDAQAVQHVDLDDHPFLAATLSRPLCGEQRVAYCYVQPDKVHAFEDYVHNELGARAMLFDSRSLLEQGWFGLGEPHPKLASRVGDYVLVMRDRATIKDWMAGEKRYRLLGVHGGVSEEEMLVPLVVVEP
jgi:hypothetical protein